jgi:hypothetical protein
LEYQKQLHPDWDRLKRKTRKGLPFRVYYTVCLQADSFQFVRTVHFEKCLFDDGNAQAIDEKIRQTAG